MAANVDIVNRALTKLGDMRISSLDDGTKPAAVAASMFNMVKDAEIAAHSWNFAKQRMMIPAEAEKPAFGWDYQYLIPSDSLRVLEAGPWPMAVMDDYIGHDTRAYIIEGQRILTNLGPALNIIYLRRISDTGLYPPVFTEVLASKLAVEMAESLTGSNSKREMAWKEYKEALQLARRVNAIGLPPVAVQDDSWMAAHLEGVI